MALPAFPVTEVIIVDAVFIEIPFSADIKKPRQGGALDNEAQKHTTDALNSQKSQLWE